MKMLLESLLNIIKCRLVDSMYNNISLFISAYRKHYNPQHVMITFRRMERRFRQKYVVEGVLMDLSKAFNCVPVMCKTCAI